MECPDAGLSSQIQHRGPLDSIVFDHQSKEVSKDTITTFNISLVVCGTVAEYNDYQKDKNNPYAVPMSMGIFQTLESPLQITTSTIIKRIVSNHEAYQKRNEKKGESLKL
ncbi:hypothetical protein Leryth_025947 [Lithospermum erythrorhizon]|nr:hypothetical protein Leryth_025947 [Lithospermum erythrorhizon]